MNHKYSIPLKSYDKIYLIHKKNQIRLYFWLFVVFFSVFLFLPWTQNIKSTGVATTLKQENRPQKINSPIPGRIAKWFVKEGDFVKAGDTILVLTEIKEDYLDPNLIKQTKSQLEAKKSGVNFYQNKINSTQQQIANLLQSKKLKITQLNNKLNQLNNKLNAEKAELSANENEMKLMKNQFDRQLKMYEDGLVSQTQLQQRNIQFQNATAKTITTENKIAQTQQEIINTRIEQNAVEQEYSEKINKTEGERFQSLSQIATSQGEIAKLENQVNNYVIRNGMYIITAPQDGQIVQANKFGIGEIVKEGESISVIVPKQADFAVEMFIRPMDLPLIKVGQKVRLTFDGFPAIVFSGWPEGSYGTFGGKVVAFENTIGENGMYRLLVVEDKKNGKEKKWPSQLRIGAGSNGIILLNNVPIWYEIWRNLNGFPADFYKPKKEEK